MKPRFHNGYAWHASASETAWETATGATAALAAIERRLAEAGAVIELRQFYGLSASEQDVLLRLERDAQKSVQPPGCPHAERGTVAA